MAINLYDRYPQQVFEPTPQYPYGAFRDRSSPTAKDGTTLQQDWSNDFFSLQWALLHHAGIVPNGTPDTVENSQYYDALLKVIADNIPDLNISNATNGTRVDWVASEKAVGDLSRAVVHKKGDTMSGNLTVENAELRVRATSVPTNNRGAIVSLRNNNGTGELVTSNGTGGSTIVARLPNRSGTIALVSEGNTADTGHWKDASTGIIMQWGVVNRSGNQTRVNFNFSFPSQCFNVQLTQNSSSFGTHNFGAHNVTKDGFTLAAHAAEWRMFWFAIGR